MRDLWSWFKEAHYIFTHIDIEASIVLQCKIIETNTTWFYRRSNLHWRDLEDLVNWKYQDDKLSNIVEAIM
jgi:hypothetical protein